MQEIKREITKEKYDYFKSQPSVSRAIEETMPIDIRCGYGFYSGDVFESGGKYFMRYLIGSSCD